MLSKDQTEALLEDTCRQAKHAARGAMEGSYDLAVDYAEGRQLVDVESQLQTRFSFSQSPPHSSYFSEHGLNLDCYLRVLLQGIVVWLVRQTLACPPWYSTVIYSY